MESASSSPSAAEAAVEVAPGDTGRGEASRRLVVGAFVALLVVAAVPRLWAAWFEHGVVYPDEVYQTLEQGHRLAFGYGLVPWEFRDGARSWLFPGAIAAVLKAGSILGMSSGLALARLVRTWIALGSVAACYAAMRIAQKTSGLSGALLAGALAALFPVSVFFGSRCFTEAPSAPLLTFAALLVMESGGERSDRSGRSWRLERPARRAAVAGVLAGLAVFLRYQNGLALLALLAVLVAARRWRDARAFGIVAAATGLFGGSLDWIAYGTPFRSFTTYFVFNVVEGKASGWGREPILYYAEALWTSTGPPLLVVLLGVALAARRAKGLTFVALTYVVVHSFVPHKQLRFLVPILPLLLALAGIGLVDVARLLSKSVFGERIGERSAAALLGAAAGVSLATRIGRETFASIGYEEMGALPAWHFQENASLLLAKAGTAKDLCGLILVGADWGYTGGYAYIHRDVPFFRDMGPAEIAAANYLVAPRGSRVPAGFADVEVRDTFVLSRRPGPCAPAPQGYSHKLER